MSVFCVFMSQFALAIATVAVQCFCLLAGVPPPLSMRPILLFVRQAFAAPPLQCAPPSLPLTATPPPLLRVCAFSRVVMAYFKVCEARWAETKDRAYFKAQINLVLKELHAWGVTPHHDLLS